MSFRGFFIDRINSISNQERDDFDYNGRSNQTIKIHAPLTNIGRLFLFIHLIFFFFLKTSRNSFLRCRIGQKNVPKKIPETPPRNRWRN